KSPGSCRSFPPVLVTADGPCPEKTDHGFGLRPPMFFQDEMVIFLFIPEAAVFVQSFQGSIRYCEAEVVCLFYPFRISNSESGFVEEPGGFDVVTIGDEPGSRLPVVGEEQAQVSRCGIDDAGGK